MNATKIFNGFSALYFGTGLFILWQFDKAEIHLAINGAYNPLADNFFKYVTHLGDGVIFLVLGIAALGLKMNWKSFFAILFAALLTLVLTAVLKQVVFPDNPRPMAFFEGIASLRYVEGVVIHTQHSFPSGHTMAAFAAWGTWSRLNKSASWGFLAVFIAMLVGYSRMYLSQHFLEDVVAGGLTGLMIAYLASKLASKLPWAWTDKHLLGNK